MVGTVLEDCPFASIDTCQIKRLNNSNSGYRETWHMLESCRRKEVMHIPNVCSLVSTTDVPVLGFVARLISSSPESKSLILGHRIFIRKSTSLECAAEETPKKQDLTY